MNKEPVMSKQQAIIIGANSSIAKALTENLLSHANTFITVISRDVSFYELLKQPNVQSIALENYQPQQIEAAVKAINNNAPITQVYVCHGVLHSESIQPEKKLEDITNSAFTDILTANTLTPLLWLQALTPLLSGKTPCKVTFFSARVGSIKDNKLGGWYSYRASKAALNMVLKTATVELARRAKNIKLIAFHPGTTDTPLSKPFQKNVPKGKLFTSAFVAEQLLNIVAKTSIDGELSYIDWQGKNIEW